MLCIYTANHFSALAAYWLAWIKTRPAYSRLGANWLLVPNSLMATELLKLFSEQIEHIWLPRILLIDQWQALFFHLHGKRLAPSIQNPWYAWGAMKLSRAGCDLNAKAKSVSPLQQDEVMSEEVSLARTAIALQRLWQWKSSFLPERLLKQGSAEEGHHENWMQSAWKQTDQWLARLGEGGRDCYPYVDFSSAGLTQARHADHIAVFALSVLPEGLLRYLQQLEGQVEIAVFWLSGVKEMHPAMLEGLGNKAALLNSYCKSAYLSWGPLVEAPHHLETIWVEAENPSNTALGQLKQLCGAISFEHLIAPEASIRTEPIAQDETLCLQACPNLWSEVLQLKTALLRYLSENETAPLETIAIVVSDLERYRPAFQAVLGTLVPSLELSFCTEPPVDKSPWFEDLIKLWQLPDLGLDAEVWVHLIDIPFLQLRFGLSPTDLAWFRDCVSQYSHAWALSETLEADTQGLELLAGYAMGSAAELLGLPVFYSLSQTDRLEKFLQFRRCLLWLRMELAQPRTVQAWIEPFIQLQATLFPQDSEHPLNVFWTEHWLPFLSSFPEIPTQLDDAQISNQGEIRFLGRFPEISIQLEGTQISSQALVPFLHYVATRSAPTSLSLSTSNLGIRCGEACQLAGLPFKAVFAIGLERSPIKTGTYKEIPVFAMDPNADLLGFLLQAYASLPTWICLLCGPQEKLYLSYVRESEQSACLVPQSSAVLRTFESLLKACTPPPSLKLASCITFVEGGRSLLTLPDASRPGSYPAIEPLSQMQQFFAQPARYFYQKVLRVQTPSATMTLPYELSDLPTYRRRYRQKQVWLSALLEGHRPEHLCDTLQKHAPAYFDVKNGLADFKTALRLFELIQFISNRWTKQLSYFQASSISVYDWHWLDRSGRSIHWHMNPLTEKSRFKFWLSHLLFQVHAGAEVETLVLSPFKSISFKQVPVKLALEHWSLCIDLFLKGKTGPFNDFWNEKEEAGRYRKVKSQEVMESLNVPGQEELAGALGSADVLLEASDGYCTDYFS